MTESKASSLPTATIRRRSWLTWAWLAPLVAVGLAGWMFYDWRDSAGPRITILFSDGSGLRPGQSAIRYRGVVVGEVRKVRLTPDLRQVEVEAQIDSSAEELCREGSRFWVVRPEVGLDQLTGLETIVSGPYIQAEAGQGEVKTEFVGLGSPPTRGYREKVFPIVLVTERLKSLGPGTLIFYRGIEVGKVAEVRLAPDAQRVFLDAEIQRKYRPLIREETEFWNESGLGVDFRWFSAEVDFQSLQGLLHGAIGLATPELEEAGAIVEDGAFFLLHEESKKDWLKWAPAISIDPRNDPAEADEPSAGSQPEPQDNARVEAQ